MICHHFQYLDTVFSGDISRQHSQCQHSGNRPETQYNYTCIALSSYKHFDFLIQMFKLLDYHDANLRTGENFQKILEL